MHEVKREKVEDNLSYLVSYLMIKRAKESNILTSEENQKLYDAIEDPETRRPVDKNDLESRLKSEFHKLKVEGKRDKRTDETSSYLTSASDGRESRRGTINTTEEEIDLDLQTMKKDHHLAEIGFHQELHPE